MEKEKDIKLSDIRPSSESESEVPTKKVSVKKSPECVPMPKFSKLYLTDSQESSGQSGKKDPIALHLELKKAYDFSPPSSDLQNKR